jgi:hypothetical protein
MITNNEKIEILINKLDTIDFIIKSYISHAEEFKNKYSLDDVLPDYNLVKIALLEEVESLGGFWTPPTD